MANTLPLDSLGIVDAEKFIFETDSLDAVEKIIRAMAEAMYERIAVERRELFVTKDKIGFDNGCKLITDFKLFPKGGYAHPKYTYICKIGGDKDSKFSNKIVCNNYGTLAEKVIETIKSADSEEFLKECGEGYGEAESYGIGYRISLSDKMQDPRTYLSQVA